MIEVDGAVVGMIQFTEELDPKYRHAGIDLFLDPALHGRGLGTDAVRKIVRLLIDERGHHRITIDPAVENHAAVRAYEKAGFKPVGVMRNSERDADGEGWHDSLLMELLTQKTRRGLAGFRQRLGYLGRAVPMRMPHLSRYLLPLVGMLVLAGCGAVKAGPPHHGIVTVTAPAGDCWIGEFGPIVGHGCGSKTYHVTMELIDVPVQKKTSGNWTLELTLREAGKIVDQNHTTQPDGFAEVTEQTDQVVSGF